MLRFATLGLLLTSAALAAPKATKVISAHPTQGKQDGRAVVGAVAAFDFIGKDSAQIAVGGNDNRVRVYQISDKRELYESKRLKKAIAHINGSRHGRFLAQRTDGKIHLFQPRKGKSAFAARPSIDHDGAGRAWLTDDGRWVIADSERDFVIYDAQRGRWRGLFGAKKLRHPHASRLHGARIMHLTPQRDGLMSNAVRDMREGSEAGPRFDMALKDEKIGQLVQAWYYTREDWLTEYCAEFTCTVTLYGPTGEVHAEITFETKTSAWGGHVPSKLSVSADGEWLFFYRARMKAELVRLKDKKSYLLGELQRTDDADPMGAFSPSNPRLLAVSMIPKAHQITLYDVGE